MTIDSTYTPQTFAPNDARTYTFTFEHIGAGTVVVSYLRRSGDTSTVEAIPPTGYSIDVGVAEAGIYTGGTVVISQYPPYADVVSIVITRRTPITQLVDYQPYTPFPADVTEFALDKQTLIDQEIRWLAENYTVTSDGNTGGSGAFIPLAGTAAGLPVTGDIQFADGDASWKLGHSKTSGQNWMAAYAESVNARFSIITKDENGNDRIFNFRPNGAFEFPSNNDNINEAWSMSGNQDFGGENTFGLYSYDQVTGLQTANPIMFFPAIDQAVRINTEGKVSQTGVVTAGDEDNVLATKKYVDDAVIGDGGLPPDSAGALLVGTGSGWASAGAPITLDVTTTAGQADMTMKGRFVLDNITDPTDGWSFLVDDLQSVNTLFISSTAAGPGGPAIISTEFGVNDFTFTPNGQLLLPQAPTDPKAAATKEYVDDKVADGTAANHIARWDGSSWVSTGGFTVDSGGVATAHQTLTTYGKIYSRNVNTTSRGWFMGTEDFSGSNTFILSSSDVAANSSVVISPNALGDNSFTFSDTGRLSLPQAPTTGLHALNRDAGDARYVQKTARGPGYAVAGGQIVSDGSGGQSVTNCWGVSACTIQTSDRFLVTLSSAVSSSQKMVVTASALIGTAGMMASIQMVSATQFQVFLVDANNIARVTAGLGFHFTVHDAGVV